MRTPLLLGLFVCFLAMLAAAPASAQQSDKAPSVALLLASFSAKSPEVQQFRQGLRDLGYVDGRDVSIEIRSAEGDYSRISALLSATVESKPDVIVVEGTVAALAVRRARVTIPLVMAVVGDPLGSGLVESLVRPGGTITGLSMMASDISTKRLQLLTEAMPEVRRVAVLWDASIPWHEPTLVDLARAAGNLGVQLAPVRVRDASEFVSAFSQIRRARVQAIYMLDSALLGSHSVELLRLAEEVNLPVACGRREWAEQGALLSYSTDFGDLFRRSARYVDRILKGAKAGELPVEQPTKFELVLNLKTARALNVRVPASVVAQADQVIR